MTTVNLKLRRTSQEGFLVILRVKNLEEETEGLLPPLPPELKSSFNQWQSAYRQIEAVRSCVAPAPGLRIVPKTVTIYSHEEHTIAVKKHLNEWLNSSESRWRPIRDRLIAIAHQLHQSNEEISIIIDAKDIDLRRLPWQEWDLFEQHYPQVEVAFSSPKNANHLKNKVVPKAKNIRILVAVGRSDGINTKDDLKVIQELEENGVEVICLMQPTRKELSEALWNEQGYHIFIFTGHSGSQKDGQIGWIELNDKDSLSIEEFQEALKQAISKGLQLAIFNSCDGLGFAHQLLQLHLPRIIVMREPVPDLVAVEFLKYFFQEFTNKNSLFASVQKARKRLEHFKSEYPGAIWLPTICIEPNIEPLTWEVMCGNNRKEPTYETPNNFSHTINKNIKLRLLASLFSVILVCMLWFSWNVVLPLPPSGIFLYGGSSSWEPIRELIDKKIQAKWPQFNLIYHTHPTLKLGSGTGIKMLLEGQISFAESSRHIRDDEFLRAAGLGIKLKQVPVAIDAIAIAVHPSLNIHGLSIEQFKGIYTGEITNWQQVGGPNLQITPYSRPDGSGTTEFFKENILVSDNFGANVKFIYTTTQALKLVGKNLNDGAIYYASASELINQCIVKTLPIIRELGKVIAVDKPGNLPGLKCRWENHKINIDALTSNDYPLTRYLFVIVKKNGQDEEKAGEFFANYLLSDRGQNIIEKAGFLRIH
ncbi:phosphate ABC transporter periplasmic phosphate-binding protein (plasmid) [Nostoc linckia NIES-25]|nr:phosphate ABC transporter periplasmic phosphate-binding protein [Nostoc linckia NIES-25]